MVENTENGEVTSEVKVEVQPEVHSTTGENGEAKVAEKTETQDETTPPKNGTSANGTTVKQEVKEEPPTKQELAIIRQIEYYFGDINLPKDNFLKEQIQIDDGWVALKTLLTFNRLSQLTKDPKVIATALRKTNGEFMQVFEDDTKVRRNPDKTLKVVNFKELNARTLYVKGFPTDMKVGEVLEFFEACPMELDNVFCRRERSGKEKGNFKGSVYLTFKSDRGAMDYLTKIKSGEKLMHNETELEVCSKEEHLAKKNAERHKGKNQKNNQEDKKPQEKPAFDYTSCGILKLTDIKAETTREDLKSVFRPIVPELFIAFQKGATSAFLRFVTQEAAQKALTGATEGDKKLETPQGEFKAELIPAGEEKEKAVEVLKKDEAGYLSRQNNNNRRGGGGGRGGGFGGRGGGHGHRGGRGGGGGNRNPFSKNRGGGGGGNKRDNPDNNGSNDKSEDGPTAAKHSKFDSDHEGGGD